MDSYDVYFSFALAAAAGLLIGIEREQSAPRDEGAGTFLGGARTHPLVALTGGLAVLVARQTGWAVVAISLATVAAFLVLNYAQDVRSTANRGFTSEAAFLASFLLGALALTTDVIQPPGQKYLVVGAVAVVVTLLLSAKPTLNPLVRRLSHEDLAATLKFLVLAVVMLPLLPDRSYGPLDALNPRQIGAQVVLIAGISFLGYAAIRLLGPQRGLGVTGIVGGLASSTAVTFSMSSRARTEPQLTDSLALSVVLASSVMFVRMVVLVAIVNAHLLRAAAVPLFTMAVAGLLVSLVLYRKTKGAKSGELKLSNPVALGQAFKFALYFAVVLIGSKAAATYLGTKGAYAAGAVAGTTDVDAITLSLARLAKGGLPEGAAVASIFLAAASNTIVKGVIAATLGTAAYRRRIGIAFAIVLAAGGAAVLFGR